MISYTTVKNLLNKVNGGGFNALRTLIAHVDTDSLVDLLSARKVRSSEKVYAMKTLLYRFVLDILSTKQEEKILMHKKLFLQTLVTEWEATDCLLGAYEKDDKSNEKIFEVLFNASLEDQMYFEKKLTNPHSWWTMSTLGATMLFKDLAKRIVDNPCTTFPRLLAGGGMQLVIALAMQLRTDSDPYAFIEDIIISQPSRHMCRIKLSDDWGSGASCHQLMELLIKHTVPFTICFQKKMKQAAIDLLPTMWDLRLVPANELSITYRPLEGVTYASGNRSPGSVSSYVLNQDWLIPYRGED